MAPIANICDEIDNRVTLRSCVLNTYATYFFTENLIGLKAQTVG